MTNTQLFLAIAIPSLLVVLSWISNNNRLNRVEDKIDASRKEMFDEFTKFRKEIYDEFKQFYRTMGEQDTRIGVLEKKH